MKNLVVTGYTKSNPETSYAYIAEWNLPNIKEYACKCNADFIAMDCNKNNDKLDILEFLKEYDSVCWIDIDMLLNVEYFYNLFLYNSNVSFLSTRDKYTEFKLSNLKILTNDQIILNGKEEIGSAILCINRSILPFIDNAFKTLLNTRPVFCDEPYWTILVRRSNFFLSLNDLDPMCCKFLDKFFDGVNNFSAFNSLHFVDPYFKRYKKDPNKTKYISQTLMYNIFKAYKQKDDDTIRNLLDEWISYNS